MFNFRIYTDLTRHFNDKVENADPTTALLKTAYFGPDKDLKFLLERGADFSARIARDDVCSGYTPLHLAASMGRLGSISLLLEWGFSIEERCADDSCSCTALMVATSSAVKLLLEKGAGIDQRDASDRTALGRSAIKGQLETVVILIDCGADLEAKDANGSAAIHLATSMGHVNTRGYKNTLPTLIEKGAKINEKNSNGWTPLHQAAQRGNAEAVTILLGKGASVSEKDIIGRTALKLAKEHGCDAVVAILEAQTAEKETTSNLAALPSSRHTIPNDYSQYTSLDQQCDEIRLVRVQTFSRNNEITCSIVRTSLTDHPPFTALSYCWGELKDTIPISVCFDDKQIVDSSYTNEMFETAGETHRDAAHAKTFNITTSLFDALRSFKHHTDGVFIWVDMLCINQGNQPERSQQVSIMTQIYKAAESVTVWLGGDPDVDSGLFDPEEAEDLGIFMTLLHRNSPHDGASLVEEWEATMAGGGDPSDSEQVDSEQGDSEQGDSEQVDSEQDDSEQGDSEQGDSEQGYDIWYDVDERASELPHLFQLAAWSLYHMYTSVPSHMNALFEAIKSTEDDLESHLLDSVLKPNSLMLRLATFLMLNHEDEFDDGQKEVWQSLSDILQRWHEISFLPYFSRVWVVQEVVNGERVKVRHGNKQLDSWELLMNYQSISKAMNSAWGTRRHTVGRKLPQISLLLGTGLRWYDLWDKVDKLKGRQLSFDDVIFAANDLTCTDPRDKIYAMAPLAKEVASKELSPNYDEPLELVFSGFTKFYIQKMKSLELLSLCRQFHRQQFDPVGMISPLKNLPSWSPDYRNISGLRLCMIGGIGEHYSADGGQPTRILPKSTSTSLYAEGVIIAKLSRGGGLGTGRFWAQMWGGLKTTGYLPAQVEKVSVSDDLDALKNQHITLERYIRTLCACCSFQREQIEVFAQTILDTSARALFKLSWSEEQFLRRHNTDPRPLAELNQDFQIYITGTDENNLLITHDGRLGLGPKMAKEGDIVVILSGSPVPFVLRERKLPKDATRAQRTQQLRDGPEYQLIGECFVDGRIHGEVFENPLFEDPLHVDPLDYDNVLYSHIAGKKEVVRERKGVYRKKFFHLV